MPTVIRRFPFGRVHIPDQTGSTEQSSSATAPPPIPVGDRSQTGNAKPNTAPSPVPDPKLTRFDWLCHAAQQPGKAAQLALMLAWQAAKDNCPAVHPSRSQLRRFGVSRDACYDGLRRLEQARLIYVWRLPGRLPKVILVEPGTDQPLRLA